MVDLILPNAVGRDTDNRTPFKGDVLSCPFLRPDTGGQCPLCPAVSARRETAFIAGK
jgi:hypothetical protein